MVIISHVFKKSIFLLVVSKEKILFYWEVLKWETALFSFAVLVLCP